MEEEEPVQKHWSPTYAALQALFNSLRTLSLQCHLGVLTSSLDVSAGFRPSTELLASTRLSQNENWWWRPSVYREGRSLGRALPGHFKSPRPSTCGHLELQMGPLSFICAQTHRILHPNLKLLCCVREDKVQAGRMHMVSF